MALLNYTTEIAPDKTVGEIFGLLGAARARSILSDYDGAGNVIAISFRMATPHGELSFRLPCNFRAAGQILNNQVRDKKIPRRYLNDTAQARRVAWRILRQWLEAQLAIVEMQIVPVEQVFLPYAVTLSGETLFERMVASKFESLALPPPAPEEPKIINLP